MKHLFSLVVLIACLAVSSARHHHRLSTFSDQIQAANEFDGEIWAVLVAGSNGYYNYRHQADVCHAYQILKSHGVPDERIIVMMYDDIADNEKNPTPGVIINRPKGPNVYAGVPKDYTGDAVTPKTFLKVLEADVGLKEAGNKVLSSGEKDHVFIYFSDHGAPGLIAFPNGVLYAKDFMKTLAKLQEKNSYNKMVIYIEACESGSMFDGLLKPDSRIYGVTAANPEEPSWAFYCETGTCLGDEFSVRWLEDSDKTGDLRTESLAQQFDRVKKAVKQSHVTHYGDTSFNGSSVAEYQGAKDVEPKGPIIPSTGNSLTRVVSYDVPIFEAEMRVQMTNSEIEQRKLDAMKKGREFIETVNEMLASELEDVHDLPYPLLGKMERLERHECYKVLVTAYNDHCFNVSRHTYALRSLFLFVNTCQNLPDERPETVTPVADTISRICNHEVRSHPFSAIV